MNFDWPLKELVNVADEVTVGYVGPMASEYVQSGIPFLRSLNIEPFIVNNNDLKYITPEFHRRIKKSSLRPGDVAIVRTGKPGTCAVIPDWLEDANCSDLVIVRCGQDIRPHFLCYWVNSIASHHISSHTVGAVQQHFNVGAAKVMKVAVPPLKIQDQVVELLGGIDNRITLLRETNATLEAIAQALFKSWFVDFAPVHAKQQGIAPEGLDEATAALFPDSFEESALGLVPKGWHIRKAETLLTRLSTKVRYAKDQVTTSGITPVYEQGVGILLGYHDGQAQFAATQKEPIFIFGDHTCVTHLSCEPFDISMNVIPLKGSDRPTLWSYYAIKDKQVFQEYRRHWMELAVKDVVVAPLEICDQFSIIASTLHVAMESKSRQANVLATLRDTLLPRLISGQLRLPEVEAALEEATA